MSVTIKVVDDRRRILRNINRVLGADIKKYLTELLTNSDDSYERLEKKGIIDQNWEHKIVISLKRRKRIMTVIDSAEGMNADDISRNFSRYGADTSKNKEVDTVRGMFGQGATDVLFTAALDDLTAKIISIKDNECTECDFLLEGDSKERIIEFKEDPISVEKTRLKYNIPNNGTVVIFGIPNSVSLPKEKFVKELSNFYMLRFLLTKKNRKVIFIEEDVGIEEEVKFDESEYKNLPILKEATFEVKYKDDVISGRIELRQNKNKKNFDNGILIYDSNKIVLDSQFFERKNYPGMEQIEGCIELNGAVRMIRKYLDCDKPEEIITDTRDGFNVRHDFYKILKNAVDPFLISACNDVNQMKKEEGASLRNNTEFAQAFKEINKYFKEELEEILPVGGNQSIDEPPMEGIRFIRQKINITKDKQYSIKLLVNTDIVPSGSLITIENNNPEIILNTLRLLVPNTEEKLLMLPLSITGKEVTSSTVSILAVCESYSAKLFIDVINKDIHYPAYGLEFFPNSLQKKPNIKSKAHLYVDTKKYALGTKILCKSVHPIITLEQSEFILDESYLINDEIAVIDASISGGNDKGLYKVNAIANNYNTELEVIVRENEDENLNKGGLINDVKYDKTVAFCQTYYIEDKGLVIINTDNIINKNMLMNVFDGKTNPNKEQKKFICDLCSMECAKIMIKKKVSGGKIDLTDFEVYSDAVQKEKVKIYEIFFKIMG